MTATDSNQPEILAIQDELQGLREEMETRLAAAQGRKGKSNRLGMLLAQIAWRGRREGITGIAARPGERLQSLTFADIPGTSEVIIMDLKRSSWASLLAAPGDKGAPGDGPGEDVTPC